MGLGQALDHASLICWPENGFCATPPTPRQDEGCMGGILKRSVFGSGLGQITWGHMPPGGLGSTLAPVCRSGGSRRCSVALPRAQPRRAALEGRGHHLTAAAHQGRPAGPGVCAGALGALARLRAPRGAPCGERGVRGEKAPSEGHSDRWSSASSRRPAAKGLGGEDPAGAGALPLARPCSRPAPLLLPRCAAEVVPQGLALAHLYGAPSFRRVCDTPYQQTSCRHWITAHGYDLAAARPASILEASVHWPMARSSLPPPLPPMASSTF